MKASGSRWLTAFTAVPGRATRFLVLGVLLVSALAVSGCAGSEERQQDALPSLDRGPSPATLQVFATTRPLCYLVGVLAQDLADCEVLADDAQSYRPTPERIVEIGNADLIVVNGLGLESWLEGASLPASRLVDTSIAVDRIELETVTHSHGPEGDHSHREVDPRVWMDPKAFSAQGAQVAAALARALPEQSTVIEQRRADLAANLDSLAVAAQQRLEAILAGFQGGARETATVSSRFRYLSRALGFEMKEFLPEEENGELSDHDLGHLKSWLSKAALPVVVVRDRQSEGGSPLQRQLASLETIDFLVVELGDLSGLAGASDESAEGYDYGAQFEENVSRLEAALSAAAE